MELIQQITEELKELGKDPTHRAALRIYNLLENNKKLFQEKIAGDDYCLLTAGFEALCNRPPVEYGTAPYVQDFEKKHHALAFHLNKII